MLTKKPLGDAIRLAIKAKGVQINEVARDFGVKPPSVQGWIKHGRIDKQRIDKLIAYFADVVPLSHWGIEEGGGLAEMSQGSFGIREPIRPYGVRSKRNLNELLIPQFPVSASMGPGSYPVDHVDPVKFITVSIPDLRKQCSFSDPYKLNIITGLGDSMEPTYRDGDILLVDTNIEVADIDAVYVLTLNAKLYVKTLQRQPDGSMLMISDNQKYKPYVIREHDECTIHGRVLIAWNARRL